ncbi:ATP-grasp domain-containing protein [Herpetosiphon geysericola]|uniref:Carboxylate--amine ligase n=1 Tax=Herpetosiphon geysericola TaxID=70996 RepID=A0A0P6Z2K4_9CHLR|nr:ATP-grasp domain-containing protein [Herpetosiphon geysericola]KPL91467.1 carboxylate--amine ligase [Herpetosiphon geysericola]
MGHLLMLESWVGGTGQILPAAITALGHSYSFVTRRREHYATPPATHPVLAYAQHVLTTETNDEAALIDFLREQHRLLHFDGVLTICDYYIDTARQVAAVLDLPCSFPSHVRSIRNKGLLRQALDRAGLANPAYQLVNSWSEAQTAALTIGYPLVIKPTDLASSAYVRLVHNDAELRESYTTLAGFERNFRDQPRERAVLLEAYMHGPEVSVEACTFAGETTILGITDKGLTGEPYFIEDSHMFPAALSEQDQSVTIELVRAALTAVGFDHGISHTEVKLTPTGPRIVEINPRVGGNYIAELVDRVSGINLLNATIELALGQRPNVQPRETSISSAAIQFLVPNQAGTVQAIHGQTALANAPHVARWTLSATAGSTIDQPIDNACYLGHVVAVDADGLQARSFASQAAALLEFEFAEQPSLEVARNG